LGRLDFSRPFSDSSRAWFMIVGQALGHFIEPKEQKTQQSPCFGRNTT
jgi:hypothetical protein